MNSVAHILFTLQALGYVAPALSLEEQLEAPLPVGYEFRIVSFYTLADTLKTTV